MSLPAIIAALAGVLAALGGLELAAVHRARRRSRPLRSRARAAGRDVLTRIGRRAGLRAPGDLGARLDAAGTRTPAADVMALKTGAAVVALLVAVVAGPGLPGRLGGTAVIVAPLLGFLAPDGWLLRRRRRRARTMERELADVLELLRVALEAGLGVGRALAEVGRRHPGLLAAELGRMAARLELGMPHGQALESLERRCPVEGIGTLAASLRRAERHGAPLGDSLATQAEEARGRRARAAAETAARAAPKIQLVVALLLVPSAMLLVAAAMIPALAWR